MKLIKFHKVNQILYLTNQTFLVQLKSIRSLLQQIKQLIDNSQKQQLQNYSTKYCDIELQRYLSISIQNSSLAFYSVPQTIQQKLTLCHSLLEHLYYRPQKELIFLWDKCAYFQASNLLTYSNNFGKIHTTELTQNPKKLKTAIHHWHAHPVRSIAYSQSMDYLYSGGQEGVIVLWQIKSQKKTFIAHLGSPIVQIILNRHYDNQQSILCILQNNKVFLINTSNYQTRLVTQNYSPISGKCNKFCYDEYSECWISPQSKGWIQFLSFDNSLTTKQTRRIDKLYDYNIVGRNFVSKIQHNQKYQSSSQVKSICVIDNNTLITLQKNILPQQNVQKSIVKIWDRNIIKNQIKLLYTYEKSTNDQDCFLQPDNRIHDIFTHTSTCKRAPHFIEIRDKSFNIWKKTQENWSISGFGNCRNKKVTSSAFSWLKPNQFFDQQVQAIRQSSELQDLQGIKKEEQKLLGSRVSQQCFLLVAFESIITRWDIAISKTQQKQVEDVKYILAQEFCQPQIQGDIIGLAVSPNNKFLAVLNQIGVKVLRFSKVVQRLWDLKIQFGYEMISFDGGSQEQFAVLYDRDKILLVFDFTSSIPIQKISLKSNSLGYGSQIVNAQLIGGGIDELFIFYDSCEIQHFNLQHEKRRLKSARVKASSVPLDDDQQLKQDDVNAESIYTYVRNTVSQSKTKIESDLRKQILKLQVVSFKPGDRHYTKQRKFYEKGDFCEDLQKYLNVNCTLEQRKIEKSIKQTNNYNSFSERNLIIENHKQHIHNQENQNCQELNQKLKGMIKDQMQNLI